MSKRIATKKAANFRLKARHFNTDAWYYIENRGLDVYVDTNSRFTSRVGCISKARMITALSLLGYTVTKKDRP